jgi:hypothetical protein
MNHLPLDIVTGGVARDVLAKLPTTPAPARTFHCCGRITVWVRLLTFASGTLSGGIEISAHWSREYQHAGRFGHPRSTRRLRPFYTEKRLRNAIIRCTHDVRQAAQIWDVREAAYLEVEAREIPIRKRRAPLSDGLEPSR